MFPCHYILIVYYQCIFYSASYLCCYLVFCSVLFYTTSSAFKFVCIHDRGWMLDIRNMYCKLKTVCMYFTLILMLMLASTLAGCCSLQKGDRFLVGFQSFERPVHLDWSIIRLIAKYSFTHKTGWFLAPQEPHLRLQLRFSPVRRSNILCCALSCQWCNQWYSKGWPVCCFRNWWHSL